MTTLDDLVHKALQADRPLPDGLLRHVSRQGLTTQRTPSVQAVLAKRGQLPADLRDGDPPQRPTHQQLVDIAAQPQPHQLADFIASEHRITVLEAVAARDDLTPAAVRALLAHGEQDLDVTMAGRCYRYDPATKSYHPRYDAATTAALAAALVAHAAEHHPDRKLPEALATALADDVLAPHVLVHPDCDLRVLATIGLHAATDNLPQYLATLRRIAQAHPLGLAALAEHTFNVAQPVKVLRHAAYQGHGPAQDLLRQMLADLDTHGATLPWQLGDKLARDLAVLATDDDLYQAGRLLAAELVAEVFDDRHLLQFAPVATGAVAEVHAGLVHNPHLPDHGPTRLRHKLTTQRLITELESLLDEDPQRLDWFADQASFDHNRLRNLLHHHDVSQPLLHRILRAQLQLDDTDLHGPWGRARRADTIELVLAGGLLGDCPVEPVADYLGSGQGPRDATSATVAALYQLCDDDDHFDLLRGLFQPDFPGTFGELVEVARCMCDPAPS